MVDFQQPSSIGASSGGIPPPPANNGPNAPLAVSGTPQLGGAFGVSNSANNPDQWGNQPGPMNETPGQIYSSNLQFSSVDDIIRNSGNLSEQQLKLYESGQLPPGEQAAINQQATSSQGALSGQLAAEGIDPATSSQFAGGSANIAIEKSTATQQALQQVLSNYFQAQGLELQASQVLGQFNQFDQQLAFEYYQLQVQQQEFQQQEKDQQKAQMGSLLGSIGKLAGGLI
jgi:hypothetical protein